MCVIAGGEIRPRRNHDCWADNEAADMMNNRLYTSQHQSGLSIPVGYCSLATTSLMEQYLNRCDPLYQPFTGLTANAPDAAVHFRTSDI